MKLYEFEGLRILSKVGIETPFFVMTSDLDAVKQARKRLKFPIVAKVQVLSGNRGRRGGVKVCTTEKQLTAFAREHLGKEFNGEQVRFIALAEKVDIESEYYISITYDTALKIPFLLFSQKGGVDIEEVKKANPEAIIRIDFDPLAGPIKKDLEKIFRGSTPNRGRTPKEDRLIDFILRLWDAFWRYDCRLIEVNPLALRRAQSKRGSVNGEFDYVAVDAKIILDDAGLARHRDLDVLSKGAISAIPSQRELAAKKIDEEDYRGSAGSTFIELDGSPRGEAGDIAILASGGGASLLVMDAVIASGGRPANYTEYSGNPSREKVEKLTQVTLSRKGLSGCLVAGAVANFTDIYETLSGFVQGLGQIKPKPDYPIVIRRGGPRQKEAYEMLRRVAKKEEYDIHLFGPETPISVACKKMVELSNQFKVQSAKFKVNGKK
ncbi:hypothetical protein A2697_03815 [Candidatus Curtissbacteria bacterium RIFCSPHIGHO2_01_FULL_41_44]|uniref:ATP-grasp domain-containing protein n=1 Tax=Candidatus Curtissbacteria bacterium RIFCSPLOWO2_01_FULL_42_50 TaxID=1797730 RepID=A0A1F5H7U5_9BACT|nr:MAG: hypothetical protein A2697_03815 [Candidatus Curtissbacteria bacterium RIFCSPHIGHO2_01_FULL_41_44]OGD94293.1 MAG: hypothetical protein A3C33_02975 [Candidatus Curtissbacteria bacterium RIFCSPHIGHO2_02_FULL_42_58]OGD97767.1 MAG: hypothetical protein A3E71_03485 [Candidatus Curtissbacteria bacterium RIFCSPHIGHO2_12_FULL_42_33]OGE00159.1 MAG: hypothetical protein A3B54_02030 [Candidatus Curtissbacteria bacterium RIFCSPLOWO2_01_FULL_42_50]OGE02085.1 MAG: hypothetical protein A3G16_00340 [Ca